MKHRVAGYKLGRDTEHRRAMWRNMAISLFTHGQITTTLPKAKSIKPFVEKLITEARKGTLTARRNVIKELGDPILVDRDLKDYTRSELRADGYKVNKFHELQDGPRVVAHLFENIAPRYTDRDGGYTRIVRLGMHRLGDGGDLCVLQLVGDEEGPQVSGQFSRRREKANKRMEFAAQLRKKDKAEPAKEEAKAEEEAPAAEEPAQDEQPAEEEKKSEE